MNICHYFVKIKCYRKIIGLYYFQSRKPLDNVTDTLDDSIEKDLDDLTEHFTKQSTVVKQIDSAPKVAVCGDVIM